MPMHQSPSASPTRRRQHVDYVVRHAKYYLPGGDLYVLIDGVSFKVHSSTNSSENAEEKEEKGKSEDRAIRFLDVTVEEFERFLWVFYNPTYDIYDADIYAWFSILKLAHKWEFPVVKDFALRELRRREAEIPLVTRIKLYQDYEAPPEYLVPLFSELCSREIGPTDEETAELGFEQMCRVWRAREALRSAGGSSPLPSGVTPKDTYAVVSEVMILPAYVVENDKAAGVDGIQPGAPSDGDGATTLPEVKRKKKKVATNPN